MKKCLLILAVGTMMASQAWAGCSGCVAPGGNGNSHTDNKVLVGINWAFGARIVPELAVGFRSIKVKNNGNASGSGVDLTFPFGNGIAFDKVRVIGLDGKNDALAQVGFGYSALAKGFLFNFGAEIPYAMAGVDYIGGTGFVPYAGLNTQGKYKKPESAGCGSGYTLVPMAGIASYIVNGMTCQPNAPL